MEPSVEMHQIRYFLAVAKELNFTRAAERCNVAQPSLTRAIKLLEEELGGPLFHRERARTHLIDLIGAVQSRYEGIELQLFDASAPTLEERLIGGDLEVGLYCVPGREHDERLHYLPLFREQFMIVVHPDHPLASQNAIRVKDLNGQRYLNRV